MVTFSVIFNSNSSSSQQDKSNNSDKFGNDIMCGAWLLNNAEELGWCSLSCSISCYYFILHLWKKIIDYFLNINSTIFLGSNWSWSYLKTWNLDWDCSCISSFSNGHIPDGPAQKICSFLVFEFFFGFTYKRSNEINFQFGLLLSNNKTYDPDVCHGGNFSKDFYKLKKSYHESTF